MNYTKIFKVTYIVKGQVFKEFFEGNLRINAIKKAYEKGADRILSVEEVKPK